jgi:hypothetical protein
MNWLTQEMSLTTGEYCQPYFFKARIEFLKCMEATYFIGVKQLVAFSIFFKSTWQKWQRSEYLHNIVDFIFALNNETTAKFKVIYNYHWL